MTDITTLLFLILAVVVILKLRSVLGRRTGNERTGPSPYAPNENDRAMNPPDKVVPLPRNEEALARQAERLEQRGAEERVFEFVDKDSPIAEGLLTIAERDKMFDPKEFLKGAKVAYEMIVTAFAAGNKKSLRDLLSMEVLEGFETAIDEREDRGEQVDFSFVGIDRADVIDAELRKTTAHVTVKFVSSLITAVKNKDGAIIDGDPNNLREVTDIWTFARDVTDRSPNWRLVATQAAN